MITDVFSEIELHREEAPSAASKQWRKTYWYTIKFYPKYCFS